MEITLDKIYGAMLGNQYMLHKAPCVQVLDAAERVMHLIKTGELAKPEPTPSPEPPPTTTSKEAGSAPSSGSSTIDLACTCPKCRRAAIAATR